MATKIRTKPSEEKLLSASWVSEDISMVYVDFLQDKEERIRQNTKLISLNQKNSKAFFARGCAWKHLNKYQQAIEDFTKAIELNSKHAPSYYKRCLAYLALDRYERALPDATRYLQLCPSEYKHLAYFNRAVCYMKMSSSEKAYDDLNEAIRLKPEDLLYQCYRARIARTQEEARRQSYQICGELPHPSSSEAFFTRALALQQCNRYMEAIHCFQDALKYDPMNIDALFQIGICHAEANKHKQAITVFNELLELLPDDSRTLLYRGMSYAALGNKDKALKDFNDALEMNQSATIYFERGFLYFKMGNEQIDSETPTNLDTQRAIKDLTKTIEIDPTSSIGFLILALAKGQEDLIKDGFQALDNTVQNGLDSVLDEIRREEKQLEQLKDFMGSFQQKLQHQKNIDPQLEQKYVAIESRYQQLQDQFDIFDKVYKTGTRVQQKIEAFQRTDSRLFRFYSRLTTKAEELFHSLKVIASGMVDPNGSGSKLGKNTTTIQLLGEGLLLVPVVGSVPHQLFAVIASGLKFIDKKRQINIATRFAKMYTMASIWQDIQNMAIELTEKYHSGILKIVDEPDETKYHTATTSDTKEKKKQSAFCSCKKVTVVNSILQKPKFFVSEKVAEYAISLLVEGLRKNRVSDNAEINLGTQFVQCVCIDKDPNTSPLCKDLEIQTTDGKHWTARGFFRKSGIQTETDHRYGGENVDTSTYGFRNGTIEEAQELGLTLIDTGTN